MPLNLTTPQPVLPTKEHWWHVARGLPREVYAAMDLASAPFAIDVGNDFFNQPGNVCSEDHSQDPIWEAWCRAPRNVVQGTYPVADLGMLDERYYTESDFETGDCNPNCWAAEFDLSGVSWTGTKGLLTTSDFRQRRTTLIGDRVAVSAWHNQPNIASAREFTDIWKNKFVYGFTDQVRIGVPNPLGGPDVPTDLALHLLPAPVSDSLRRYDLATELSFGQFLLATRSRPAQGTGLPNNEPQFRAAIERLTTSDQVFTKEAPFTTFATSENFYGPTIAWASYEFLGRVGGGTSFREHPDEPAIYHDDASTGDSSDPLFAWHDGQLKLVSCYLGITGGPWHGRADMLTAIDAQLAIWGVTRGAHTPVAP